MLLALARVVFLRSKSLGTRDPKITPYTLLKSTKTNNTR
jgi:hypothetical protein